jgi:hypothetical protein
MTTFDDAYLGLRDLALNARPEEIGVTGGSPVYGALLEIDMGDAVITLACFSTGDASLYYSNGGGMVGGIAIPSVRAEALRMVSAYGDDVSLLAPVGLSELPTDGHASFVALTPSGTYAGSAPIDEIVLGTTKVGNLFDAGQRVITAFRESDKNVSHEVQKISP